MNNKIFFTILNLVSYVFLVGSSFFVRGETAFSVEGVEPLISPAPYAFYIWPVIYLLVLIWIIRYGFKKGSFDQTYINVSYFLPLSLAAIGGSLLTGQPIAGLFIIMGLLFTMGAYVSCTEDTKKDGFFRLPFSLYLGWLSVATIIEVSILLKSNGLTTLFGLSEVVWSVIVLILGSGLAILVNVSKVDFVYPLVFIWAYIAIAIEQMNQPIILVVCCAAILLIALVMDRVKKMLLK